MSIKVYCRRCKKELKELGALIISPPETETRLSDKVYKMHICLICYFELMEWFGINDKKIII